MNSLWPLQVFWVLLLLFVTGEDAANGEQIGYIPNGGVYLGRGFDILAPQTVFPLCIASTRECQTGVRNSIACLTGGTARESALGETTSFSIKQIHSKSEFFQEIDISASLSASYGPFSVGGSFSSSALDQINQDSLSWMISAKGYYGSFALAQPALSPSVRDLSPTEILDKCGPQYVSAVQRGVVATALFTIYNLDEQHKRSLQASLSAGFSTGGWGVNASFSSVVQQALQYGSMSINVFTIGGTGDPGLADLIKLDPTNLPKIKAILNDYVKAQDVNRAAIVSFQTTSFARLATKPFADPDLSNYFYFLDTWNNYRLDLQDAQTKVSTLLSQEKDFSAAIAAEARDLRSQLDCEIAYAEEAIMVCRSANDVTRRFMLGGDTNDRRVGRLALSYGLSPSVRTLSSCSSGNMGTFGWALKVNDFSSQPATGGDSCTSRIRRVRTSLQNMLQTAESGGRLCVSTCESLDYNYDLIAEVRELPKYPFNLTYWFDAGNNFSGSTSPGLYIAINNAQNVTQVRFYNDQDHDAFGVRSNSGSPYISVFVATNTLPSGPVRVELDTTTGNTYVVMLPHINPI